MKQVHFHGLELATNQVTARRLQVMPFPDCLKMGRRECCSGGVGGGSMYVVRQAAGATNKARLRVRLHWSYDWCVVCSMS